MNVGGKKGYVAVDVKLIDFSFCRLGIEGVLSLLPALRSAKMPGLRERGGRNLWLILTAAPPCVRKFSHARFSNSPRSVPFSPFDRLHGRCCLPSSPRTSVQSSVEFNHRQRCDRRPTPDTPPRLFLFSNFDPFNLPRRA